jgi:hypothetical protein
LFKMFALDEATSEAIHRAFDEGGELSAVVELRRHFPLIADNARARLCVRIIANWRPSPKKDSRKARHSRGRAGEHV